MPHSVEEVFLVHEGIQRLLDEPFDEFRETIARDAREGVSRILFEDHSAAESNERVRRWRRGWYASWQGSRSQ